MSWFDVAWTLSKARIRSPIQASVSCSPLTDVSIASSFSSFNKIASSFASRFADMSGVVRELSSPSWLEVESKVKVERLGFLQFFDVRMGVEVSSEEEDRNLFISNIFFA